MIGGKGTKRFNGTMSTKLKNKKIAHCQDNYILLPTADYCYPFQALRSIKRAKEK